MYHFVFLFLFSIGLPTFLMVWWLEHAYFNHGIGGWALVFFHLAIGFLSVGLFGALSFVSRKAQGSVDFPNAMPIVFGPLLATGVFIIFYLTLLNKSDFHFFLP